MSVKNHIAQKYSAKRRQELMDDFLVYYEKSLGVITPAAKATGVHRGTIYRWREAYPEFDAACREIEEAAVDFVESKMFTMVDKANGDAVPLIIFYLKTKGKHRGYVEKQEVDMSAEVKGVTVNVSSPETKQILEDIMAKDKQ
jgi:dihydroorotate dehydrogenase